MKREALVDREQGKGLPRKGNNSRNAANLGAAIFFMVVVVFMIVFIVYAVKEVY